MKVQCVQEEVTFPVIMGLTEALRNGNFLTFAPDLLPPLQALHNSIHSHSNPLAALPASSTDAAFLLCRLDTLGLRPLQSSTNTNKGAQSKTKGTAGKSSGTSRGSAAPDGDPGEEIPLAELLTRRLALRSDEVPPGLLVCATLASSTLLGYMHVPLVKV